MEKAQNFVFPDFADWWADVEGSELSSEVLEAAEAHVTKNFRRFGETYPNLIPLDLCKRGAYELEREESRKQQLEKIKLAEETEKREKQRAAESETKEKEMVELLAAHFENEKSKNFQDAKRLVGSHEQRKKTLNAYLKSRFETNESGQKKLLCDGGSLLTTRVFARHLSKVNMNAISEDEFERLGGVVHHPGCSNTYHPYRR